MVFETDQGATGSVVASQVSLGRKNKLWFSFDGTESSYVFDQEQPDSLWVGGTSENRVVPRGPQTLGSDEGRRLSFLPAGHPQGYQDCFNAFVADTYAAVAGSAPQGLADLRRRTPCRTHHRGSARLRQDRLLDRGSHMKLGFLTACLPDRSLEDIVTWAAQHEYEALEVAAWPDLGNRPFTATHLKAEGFGLGDAEQVAALFDQHGLTLSSLAFYDNNLHPDADERRAVNDHVIALVDAAVAARLSHGRHLRRPRPGQVGG